MLIYIYDSEYNFCLFPGVRHILLLLHFQLDYAFA